MVLEQFFVEGLGCASYLVGCETEGVAAVVDPERDVQRYLEAAQARGLRITYIIETHLHADHVSGNTDLAARTGAEIFMHEGAHAEFAHHPLNDGDRLELGCLRLEVRHTPGHTPDSITLLVRSNESPQGIDLEAALTGDLLFVGDVGRPDLVAGATPRKMAGQLYDSLFNNLLLLPDGVAVYPGHGTGSLCGRSIGSARSTTIGLERQQNPALAYHNREEFIEKISDDLPEQPGNHIRIKQMNQAGPKPLGEIVVKTLSIAEAIPYFQKGAGLLDTRPQAAYRQLHVPGSVHLEADEQLSNRIGSIVPPETPLVLMLAEGQKTRDVVLSLARVGFENVVGVLSEGMQVWKANGLPVTSGEISDISSRALADLLKENEPPVVVDVREPWEYQQGHIAGAVLMPLGQLAWRIQELDPAQPVAVVCASGSRSQTAAGLLGQKGFSKIFNLTGGMHAWVTAGLPVSR